MKTFKQYLTEKYSKENTWLLQYMRSKDLDLYILKPEALKDIIYKHFPKLRSAFDEMGDDMFTSDYLEYIDDKDIDKLQKYVNDHPDEWEKWVYDEDYQNLTQAAMELSKDRLLKRTTWLVHFSDDTDDIIRKGFKGTYEMDKLALTSYNRQDRVEGRGYEGYNFAFEAESRDAYLAARMGTYGDACLLFQNSGVKAYHYGDEEEQIMFWGPDVDKKKLILLDQGETGWFVVGNSNYKGHPEADDYPDNALYWKEDAEYSDCVNWVIKNHKQYRRVIYQ